MVVNKRLWVAGDRPIRIRTLLALAVLVALLAALTIPHKAGSEGTVPEEVSKKIDYVEQENYLEVDPAAEKIAYENWVKEKEAEAKRKAELARLQKLGYNPCNCVSYVRWKTGINTGSIRIAINHPINSKVPKVGAILVTNESQPGTYTGHLAFVEEVIGDTIVISEVNFEGCYISKRTLRTSDPVIIGYYIYDLIINQ